MYEKYRSSAAPARRFLEFSLFLSGFHPPVHIGGLELTGTKKVFLMSGTLLSLTNDKEFSDTCSALGKAFFLVPVSPPVFFDGVEIATFFWTVDISTAPFSASGL